MDTTKVITSEVTDRVVTLEQLFEIYKIDPEVWEVEKKVVNTWEVGSKNKEGAVVVTPLFQVKAWLKRKKVVEDLLKIRQDFLEDLKQLSPEVKKFEPRKNSNIPYLLEINISDLHFGKIAWKEEVGEEYNITVATERFNSAIEYFIQIHAGHSIEKILFPISNDFFNSDRSFPYNSTTSGTPQEEDARWQNTFRKGRQMLVKNIQKLSMVAPVEVKVIPGNHDYERSFYLGDSLEGWFHNNENVTVDNRANPRKYFKYGKCLIGYTHGNNEKLSTLPMIMAQENPEWWGQTQYREFHLGHLHHKKETEFRATDEHQGVIIRHMSSLSGTDSWHHKKGYIGARKSAEAFLWDANTGLVNQTYFNL